MILTEYDEELHMRTVREEGREEGLEKGKKIILKEQIRKKLLKGKPIAIIAEELEEEIPTIEALIAEMEEENEPDAL